MTTFYDTNGPNHPRWQQPSIARLQRAWNYLRRLVMGELVLIPIRIEQPESLRQSKRSAWRD